MGARWFFLLGFLILQLAGSAQVRNAQISPVQISELNGPWRFQTGDQPEWSDPAFDDRDWALLRPDLSFYDQGYRGYSGVAWYRLTVPTPGWDAPLALYLPAVEDSCQIFVNGTLIGQSGGLPPHPKAVAAARLLYTLPAATAVPGRPLTIAIRIWRWPRAAAESGGGLDAAPRIGSSHALREWQQLENHDVGWRETDTVLSFLANILTAVAGLALFALRPKEREYLWFGAAQTLWGFQALVHCLVITRPVAYLPAEALMLGATAGAKLLNLEFFVVLIGLPRRQVYWVAVTSALLSAVLIIPGAIGWIGNPQASSLGIALETIYGICVPALLYRGIEKNSPEAKLLFVPFTLSFVCNVATPLLFPPVLQGRSPFMATIAHYFWQLFTWPFPVKVVLLAGDLAMFSVVAVLVLRFARSRRDEERLVSELEAARAVQKVMIPEKIPCIRGLDIECVYKPAGEVGGDFFQILPLSGENALIIIGDVSGKGLAAAMTVSLLVGMVQMLAESPRGPAGILQALNKSIMGRTPAGFTTCLILHMAPGGVVTAANAGHIPPYKNGLEVALESGLPLGLVADCKYTESSFSLGAGDRITLLTDGVPEARKPDGELFGFDRAASMSNRPASEIATAARLFGQEDDITVLSMTRSRSAEQSLPFVALPVG